MTAKKVAVRIYVLSTTPLPLDGHPKRHDQYRALCLGPGVLQRCLARNALRLSELDFFIRMVF